ncbi:MAG: ATP-binding cassette domain-containing protein, partial [Clostridia bacterium]|nr:ATP-binding cassette domain-containing protein [Clostridia bacterium]
MAIIAAESLRKVFTRGTRLFGRRRAGAPVDVEAVRDLSFRIEPGEFVGFLGPNGAGKSTTIKMMTGILHPTSGRVTVDGLSPQADRVRLALRIGVVFGQRTQLWWDLPLRESFRILRAMYRVPAADYRRRMEALTELLGLDSFMDTPVRQLSLGQRMRGELAGALLHGPRVLFLDEPTIGLDVTAKAALRQFLRSLNAEFGTTVILTTHDMTDVEELCQRILVINQGTKVFDGSLAELHERVGMPSALRATFRDPPDRSRLPRA